MSDSSRGTYRHNWCHSYTFQLKYQVKNICKVIWFQVFIKNVRSMFWEKWNYMYALQSFQYMHCSKILLVVSQTVVQACAVIRVVVHTLFIWKISLTSSLSSLHSIIFIKWLLPFFRTKSAIYVLKRTWYHINPDLFKIFALQELTLCYMPYSATGTCCHNFVCTLLSWNISLKKIQSFLNSFSSEVGASFFEKQIDA